MSDWSLDLARKTYSIPHWSEGYFEVDSAGRILPKMELEIEARRVVRRSDGLDDEIRELELIEGGILQSERNLEDGISAEIPRWLELLHKPFEREILVRERTEGRLARAADERGHLDGVDLRERFEVLDAESAGAGEADSHRALSRMMCPTAVFDAGTW